MIANETTIPIYTCRVITKYHTNRTWKILIVLSLVKTNILYNGTDFSTLYLIYCAESIMNINLATTSQITHDTPIYFFTVNIRTLDFLSSTNLANEANINHKIT